MVMSRGDCFFLLSWDDDLTEEQLQQVTQTIESNDAQCFKLVVLGDSDVQISDRVSVTQFFVSLYRRHLLHRNERVTMLSPDDQLIALQLCLAEKRRQEIGDFDVEASTVIEMNRHIIKQKLSDAHQEGVDSVGESGVHSEKEDILKLYSDFLTNCNYTDLMDIYTSIKQEVDKNEMLQKELWEQNYLILCNPNEKDVEKAMLEFLCQQRSVYEVHAIQPMGSLTDNRVDVKISISSLSDVLLKLKESCPQFGKFTSPHKSATEMHVYATLVSYLELLLNSRSEIALARVINTPNRGLDHKAFTELKRYAKEKKMPMYQTALSFIMKIRLGGKGYAPDKNSPLAQHVKGMGEFSDLLHKLQTIVEEDLNPKSSCRRIVNMLKMALIRSKENLLRHSSIESATQRLQSRISDVIDTIDQSNLNTPDKSAGRGGTLVGRQTVKVIRLLLDQEASQSTSGGCADIFGDRFSSQKTPIRFQSLLSQFRSPEEESPSSKLNSSLADRMKAKIKKNSRPEEKKSVRYQSDLEWAVPLHSLGEQEVGDICTDQQVIVMPSKTLVQPGRDTVEGLSVANRVLESMQDQENIGTNRYNKTMIKMGAKAKCEKTASKNLEQKDKSTKESNVRPRDEEEEGENVCTDSQPPSKKAKLQTAKAKKNVRRKLIPQIKGQQSLAKFFRM